MQAPLSEEEFKVNERERQFATVNAVRYGSACCAIKAK
jgi:hypothetical protein